MGLFKKTSVKTASPSPPQREDLLPKSPAGAAEGLEAYVLPPYFEPLREYVQEQLLRQNVRLQMGQMEEGRQIIRPLLDQALVAKHIVVPRKEKERLLNLLVAEILGYGPIQPLLDDPTITEIMVNGPYQIYVEKEGRILLTPITFTDEEHVMRIIERIVAPLGRRVDESSPMADARLPDGSRVNIVIPPLSLNGPCITIRKFFRRRLSMEDLIRFGSVTPEFAVFAEAVVRGRANIIISGGTGSGKTTMLNILSGYIPSDERIITIEDAAELQLQQEHVVRLEARPPNVEGRGEIPIRELVINALRMRPDRIIVGEVRGGEALDMLQAMNTGHDGSMTTLHSNGPRDTLSRLETMVLMAGMELPLRAIRQQIASAIDLIIHVSRMRDGSRKVVAATEVLGLEGDTILLQDVFVFDIEGFEGGKVIGRLRPTGIRPRLVERLADYNVHLPPDIFGQPTVSAR
ncbi:MAG: CpaF family protein [Chloroflexi bacterium]|nr:CpaF family protein [Chloroflexota bacterium]